MKEFTDDDLTAIARQAALDSTHRYSYMPAMPEDAAQWVPHRWVIEAMRAILAAPAVERQEPAGYANSDHLGNFEIINLKLSAGKGSDHVLYDKPLYTSPPAPVSVVLPERRIEDFESRDQALRAASWNACIDKVKELNQ
jgi:hypothetical protein